MEATWGWPCGVFEMACEQPRWNGHCLPKINAGSGFVAVRLVKEWPRIEARLSNVQPSASIYRHSDFFDARHRDQI